MWHINLSYLIMKKEKDKMANIALLIAGGSGNRMGQSIPKQFLTVNERPVIVYTLEAFQKHPEIDEIAVVCIEGWQAVLQAYANQFNITKLKYIVPGGKNGQDSIRNGVYELEKHHNADDIVLIHDAIRPMVSADIISDCIRVTREKGNAITVIPCAEAMMQTEDKEEERNLPSLRTSLIAPVVTIVLLALRPAAGINIDPLIALPVGGLCGAICMKQWKNILPSIAYGLQKMSVVAILLIGTGTIAGIIKNSSLKDWILTGLDHAHMSDALIAPISGALMSAATASTTAGATLASSSFAETILAIGISAVWGAAMINSGATVLDHLPHGSFFHATGGVCELNFKERLKLIPYESLIGIVLAAGTTILYIISN